MVIYFKRSGGFAGMLLQADLDTSLLPADEAKAIEQSLADAKFFDLPSEPDGSDGIDRFTYELRVVGEDTEHTVCFSEEDTPAEIDSLLRQLTLLARRPAADAPEDPTPPAVD